MAKRYRSDAEGIAVRTEACRLATQVLTAGDDAEIAADRMWAWCVYFESYIAHGARATRKNMGLAKERPAPVIKLVRS